MSQLFLDDGVKKTGRKVLIATTCYDNPDASYTFSIQRSREALHKAGIQTAYFLLTGNCHVDDARNVMVQEFLLSDCDEMIFIDADVSWQPRDLLKLCSYEDCEIVGGVYPFRRASKKADMPVRMMKGKYEPDERGLLEVEGLPTGFMKIRREVLEQMASVSPSFWNKEDRRSKVAIIFERVFDKEKEIRWGGDLNFCNKWRAMGGRVYAAYEMTLGHIGKEIFKSSLGSALRKQAGVTLPFICDAIHNKKENMAMYTEAREYCDNHYGALEDVLATSVALARQAKGPIVETGSGLTTILMAAANPDHVVYAIEHNPLYAAKLRDLVRESGVKNVGLVESPIKDGWYDLSMHDDLPEQFALGLNDGPPRWLGSRMGFFEVLADKCEVIVCDDMEDWNYQEQVVAWAERNERELVMIESRTGIIKKC